MWIPRSPGRLGTAGILAVPLIATAVAAASLSGGSDTRLTFRAAAKGEPLVAAHRGASG